MDCSTGGEILGGKLKQCEREGIVSTLMMRSRGHDENREWDEGFEEAMIMVRVKVREKRVGEGPVLILEG